MGLVCLCDRSRSQAERQVFSRIGVKRCRGRKHSGQNDILIWKKFEKGFTSEHIPATVSHL